MPIARKSLPALMFLVSALSLSAMGTAEELRFPVRQSADGELTVISTAGHKVERMSLPAFSPDGYRFSWQGSFYELATYPSGRFAVLSLDKYLKGRTLGHTVFLKGRSDPEKPIPEWVTDERLLLTGLPQYSGFLALRYSRASMASTKKLTVERVLRDTILPFVVSTLENPSDSDRATAAILADDLARSLSSGSRLSTYWIEILRRAPNAAPKDTDFVSTRKIYALVEVPIEGCLEAIAELQRSAGAGDAPEYASPSGVGMLEALSAFLRKETGIGSTP
ncbi:MAG TPA: hypothetical protein P5313_00520 [Spirochaetia bacterium]|nr:hypothetical protein [Spirochaetia bacterium]